MKNTTIKSCNITPTNFKKGFKSFDDIYFIKLNFDEIKKNIIIICYNTIELENKRYEVKISKNDFEHMDKIFKIYDELEEIYELIIPIIESNKYKIYFSNDEDKITIELNFIINFKNNDINLPINIDMNSNTNGDFTSDYNYILRNEIIKLRAKYNKEIYDLKFQNKEIINELNGIKKIIKTMCNKDETPIYNIQKKIINDKSIKILNLKGKNLDINNLINLVNYPNLEELNLSDNKISDISMLDKCRFLELKNFNISNNQISDITVLKDFKFQRIEELYLNQNKIYNLESLTQLDLTHLQKIDLSYNNIEDLNIFFRVNAPQLKYLNLSHNFIEDIEVFGTVEFKELKELYLDNNQISEEMNIFIIEDLKSKITIFTYK